MPSGTPSMPRTPFTDSDDRDLVAFLAIHHPSKEGRMGNAVYKLLTEQPKKWPWGKRHTWMSWRERYKNHEARFDHHIKAFQNKNKISKRAVPMGFEAMMVSGMDDLDDFGTDEEEEDRRPHGKRPARADSDTEDEDEESTRPQSRPVNKTMGAPKQPLSKRKRVSDTNDRTPKRSRVIEGSGSRETNGSTEEKKDDAMDQDSQGEETLEVEQNLICPSDEDSLTTPQPRSKSPGSTPKRPPHSGDPVASASKSRHTPRTREPVHRPHSPKNPPSTPFSTIDLDESETDSPIVPKRAWKRSVPKIVESAFGRNEQSDPLRPSQTRADLSPEFDLLVERRAARKAVTSKPLEPRPTKDDTAWKELRNLRRHSPEPGLSSSSTSKRGSVEPNRSSPSNQPTPQLRPRPPPSATIDDAEKKMIEAREELSKLALKFQDRPPRSPLGPKSPDTIMNDDKTHPLDEPTHPFDETTHPFDETTHPFDETTHPFDETTHPFDDSQTQTQEVHPFDEGSRSPNQELHPFDESTQQPQDSIPSGQNQYGGLGFEVGASDIPMRDSPMPPAPGSSKRRTDAFLTPGPLGSRKSRISLPDLLRPGSLSSPNNPPRFPQDLVTNGLVTPNNPPRRLKVATPVTASQSTLRSPRSPPVDAPILSPRRARAGGVTPNESRPRSTAAQELRELLENSPRTRRSIANGEFDPQTHEKPPKTSERKITHKTRIPESPVKSETATPRYYLRSKSTANDDPFSSPAGLMLSSPYPQEDATMPDAEQESPLAPHTTSQSALDATIKSRQVRREAAQERSRRLRDPERPDPSKSLGPTTAVVTTSTPRKSEGVEVPRHADREEDVDAMNESQTYGTERDLYDVTGTPMMDLSFRPPRRIPPTYRTSAHPHHRTSSSTANSRDHGYELERDKDVHKPSRCPEREIEKDVQGDHAQWRDSSKRLSGVSFGSPIAASSPRRNDRGKNYDRQDRNTTNASFSSRTSFESATLTASPAVGIMARPPSLGFAPSEMDAYLGIQVACEKIAKTHGFQSDAVFRVYHEVKDLRKAEEIVIGMKRAAEKDAIERIMRVREKTEKRRVSERSGESSSYRDRGGGHSRSSQRSYDDVRDEDEDDDQGVTDRSIIYEEEKDDSDGAMRVEHLSHRNKRPSTSSTSVLGHRGGYDRPRTSSTTTVRMRERNRQGSMEYHPPTPTRANLWERLSKSGKHPDSALLGESMRASLSMPRYEIVNHE